MGPLSAFDYISSTWFYIFSEGWYDVLSAGVAGHPQQQSIKRFMPEMKAGSNVRAMSKRYAIYWVIEHLAALLHPGTRISKLSGGENGIIGSNSLRSVWGG